MHQDSPIWFFNCCIFPKIHPCVDSSCIIVFQTERAFVHNLRYWAQIIVCPMHAWHPVFENNPPSISHRPQCLHIVFVDEIPDLFNSCHTSLRRRCCSFSFFPNGRLVSLMFVNCASVAEHTHHVQSLGGAATLLPAKKNYFPLQFYVVNGCFMQLQRASLTHRSGTL